MAITTLLRMKQINILRNKIDSLVLWQKKIITSSSYLETEQDDEDECKSTLTTYLLLIVKNSICLACYDRDQFFDFHYAITAKYIYDSVVKGSYCK